MPDPTVKRSRLEVGASPPTSKRLVDVILSLYPTVGLLYTVLIALVAGSGIWTWLMSRHPASLVAPFSLFVPVFGMTSAWLLLGEGVRTGELVGAALIVGGVLIGTARWGRQGDAPAGVPMTRHLTSEPRPVL